MSDITICDEAYNKLANLDDIYSDNCEDVIINNLYDYPLLNIATKSSDEITPNYSVERNLHFIIGHCGFFLFNFINCWAIVLINGFVRGRFWKNRLMKFAFAACFWQVISCMCSITRFSINDEYGVYAHWANITGIIAYIIFNYVACHILICHNNQIHALRLVIVTAGIGVFTFVWGDLIHWEVDNFKHFRRFIAFSTILQLLAYARASWYFYYGYIKFDEGLKDEETKQVNRILWICIFSTCNALGLAGTGFPVLQYPATGITFSVMLVAVTIVGEMGFMHPGTSTNDAEMKVMVP